MPGSAELNRSVSVSSKRSVFRSDVLQHEIERRDTPIELDGVSQGATLALVSGAIALTLAIAALLWVPVTVASGATVQEVSGGGKSLRGMRLVLLANDHLLVPRGSFLEIEPSTGFVRQRLRVIDSQVLRKAPNEISVGEMIQVDVREPSSPFTGALIAGSSRVIGVRTSFLDCLIAIARPRSS